MKAIKICLLTSAIILSNHQVDAIEIVDVELQLLIDISGSVNTSEYNLQMQGYQAAFESDTVQDAIINGHYGQIAVQLIMWSGATQQQIMIDWALIDSDASADDFASNIAALTRPFAGMTAIGSAISFAYPQFSTNDFDGTTNVIDISGDGTTNSGTSVSAASQDALNAGVDTINGIVITQNQAVIDEYTNDVVGGEDPFLLAPANFDDFQTAIENKIVAEIEGTTPEGNLIQIPEPSSYLLWLLTFGSLIVSRLYKRGE